MSHIPNLSMNNPRRVLIAVVLNLLSAQEDNQHLNLFKRNLPQVVRLINHKLSMNQLSLKFVKHLLHQVSPR